MERKRARAYGVTVRWRPRGERNAITDVAGVRVGHKTVVRDPSPDGRRAVRTGVTAVFPPTGALVDGRVYAGTPVLNGLGELIGIVLTSSLAIGKAYDATVRWRAEHHATMTSRRGHAGRLGVRRLVPQRRDALPVLR